MKAKKDDLLICVLFCAFLGIMSLLFFFGPKSEFSQLEKRYLAEFPELTWESLTSGKFGEDMESYMADHIPGRDFFVGLQAYYERFLGQQVSKDIYVAGGDRLVEAPVRWDPAAAEKNMSAINAFSDSLGKKVDFMLVPSAGWACQEDILGLSDPYEDEKIIENIYAMAGERLNCLELTGLFRQAEAPLYYRTDHHWNSLGAYTAYEAYMQALGRPCRAKEDFTVETAEGFFGSTYSRSALWLTPPEELELWTGSPNITVQNGESQELHQGVFYRQRLEELDKYTVYLDGNHSTVRIENPDAVGRGTLLVVRDSYSNCLGAFLAESYETVILVDLRYYKQPVSELIARENADDVLICYSIGNFLTDANIIWLR